MSLIVPQHPPATASGWSSVAATLIYSGTVSYSLSGGERARRYTCGLKTFVGNVSNSASATVPLIQQSLR